MNTVDELKSELEELRETHKRMAEHLGVSPNFLLTNYYKFGEKALKVIEKLEKK
jgi:hypothetical protein